MGAPALNEHPLFLTGEDGEVAWALRSAFPTPKNAVRAYNKEYGSDWPDNTPAREVWMRHAPEQNSTDPEWHTRVDGPGPGVARYWEWDF
jgi:hypothetical protein